MPERSPILGVVIVNFNGGDTLGDCLRALERSTLRDFITVVVDNGSTDSSRDVIHSVGAPLIELERNFGFARGVNAGLEYLREQNCKYVMLLNNDAVVRADTLARLVRLLDADVGIAGVGPTIHWAGGDNGAWYAGGAYSRWTGIARHRHRVPRRQDARVVSYVPFCAFMVRRSVMEEVGLVREDLFLYSEDVDYCCRLRAAGYRLCYLPSAAVEHIEGWSGRRALSARARQALATRNLLRVHSDHRRPYHLPSFAAMFLGRWVLVQAVSSLRPGRVFALPGVVDGIRAYIRGEVGAPIAAQSED